MEADQRRVNVMGAEERPRDPRILGGDDWHFLERRRLGDGATNLIAVHLRHHEVEQDQVGPRRRRFGDAFLAVGGSGDLEPGFGEHELHDLEDRRAVVDDEDGLAWHVRSLTHLSEGDASRVGCYA